MRTKLPASALTLLAVLAVVVAPSPAAAQQAAAGADRAGGDALTAELAWLDAAEQSAATRVERLDARRERLRKTLDSLDADHAQFVLVYGGAAESPPEPPLDIVAQRIDSLRAALDGATGSEEATRVEHARLGAAIAATEAHRAKLDALLAASMARASASGELSAENVELAREYHDARLEQLLEEQNLALTTLDACDTLRRRIRDRRLATIALLERENLLLRGTTSITMSAVADGAADLSRFPAWSVDTLGTVMSAVRGGRHTGDLLRWAGASLVLLLGLVLARRRMRRGIRPADELDTDAARVKNLACRLLASLVTGVAVAAPWLLAVALIEGLPAEWRVVLRTFGLVLGGLIFGCAVAGRLLRARGEWSPIEMDVRSAMLMRTGIVLVLWLSALIVPIGVALGALGYANAGALALLWTVYKVLAVVLLLLFVLRKGVLLGILPPATTRVGRGLRRALTVVHPVLVVVGPALLALDFLQYDILATFMFRVVGGVLVAGAVGFLAHGALQRGVAAWLRSVVGEPEDATPETSRVDAALTIGRYAVLLTVLFGALALMSVVQGGDVGALREFLDVDLPFQGQVEGVHITWFDVIAGITLMTLFLTAVPKLKLFLERFVLPRMSLDAGLRYTISTLAGYVFAALGIYVGLVQIFDLGALGYVFAALSVGIGFGLQEIVSNFVSGLILLFERPIKVGDLITVGTTEGWVSKINIRATTIQTRDNVSMLIPNKDFITQAVVNSVYGDTILRVRVSVGVAYGSDTALVRSLLLRAAREHPEVLTSRPPDVAFRDFGASSLDFTLMCWIPEAEEHMRVASALRFKIDALFRENGIEIPFSQHDLHLRSIDEDAAARLRGAAPDAVADDADQAR